MADSISNLIILRRLGMRITLVVIESESGVLPMGGERKHRLDMRMTLVRIESESGTFLVFYICKSEENDLKHGNYICKSEEYVPWLKRERANGLSQCCRDKRKKIRRACHRNLILFGS
jgi:hypothetical protein